MHAEENSAQSGYRELTCRLTPACPRRRGVADRLAASLGARQDVTQGEPAAGLVTRPDRAGGRRGNRRAAPAGSGRVAGHPLGLLAWTARPAGRAALR